MSRDPGSQQLLFEPWPLRERVSARARRMRVEVRPDGEVVLTLPLRASARAARRFLDESRTWIERTRRRLAAAAAEPLPVSAGSLTQLRARAREEGRRLLDEEAARLGVRYTALAIRDARTRWGSCGADGRIMLSLRLALAPPDVFRYVVIHELCHLRWRGHGPRFWALVARQMPEFEAQRAWLRRHGARLHAVKLAP